MRSKVIFLVKDWLILMMNVFIMAHTSSDSITLQIVSDVYKKQPYIPVPSATIDVRLRNNILLELKEAFYSKWQVQLITPKGDWLDSLRFRPAVSIAFYKYKNPHGVFQEFSGILLIYPKNYRGLIEDPLAEIPPPILYLGGTRRLAFYYHPPNNPDEEIPQRIIQKLNLK